MSDFRYAPIYGRNPWLMVEDADEVADFFRNSGTPFVSHRRDIATAATSCISAVSLMSTG